MAWNYCAAPSLAFTRGAHGQGDKRGPYFTDFHRIQSTVTACKESVKIMSEREVIKHLEWKQL